MQCLQCQSCDQVIKKGSYLRPKDQKRVLRFYCKACRKGFSQQTGRLDYRHRKRWLNQPLFRALCKGNSQRGCAFLFHVKQASIARRVKRFGEVCEHNLKVYRQRRDKVSELCFDEMESFEHTKCKPLTIPIAVENKTRKILALGVGSIRAKGLLAKISVKKYGPRTCQRRELLNQLARDLKSVCHGNAQILTDQSPHYPLLIERHFPKASHLPTKGRRGCVVGQGELKRGGHDLLFSLNHSYAMFRDNLKTLSRRTWCTTKRVDRLRNLLFMYAWFHNLRLDSKARIKLKKLSEHI